MLTPSLHRRHRAFSIISANDVTCFIGVRAVVVKGSQLLFHSTLCDHHVELWVEEGPEED